MKNEEKEEIKLAFKKEFVLKMKAMMNRLNLTQKELSEQTGKKPPQINRLLNEKNLEYPTIDFLIKIRELYKADLNYLLSFEKLEVKQSEVDRTSSEIVLKKSIINDWDTPLLPGEYRYLKEDLTVGKDINDYLRRMEEVEGRIYISPIFPSGLHRIEKIKNLKDDKSEKLRNTNLKSLTKRNWEFYTIASFLQFGFSNINERLYNKSQKIQILKQVRKYFSEGEDRELYFIDTSKAAKPDDFFYGFPITRLVQKEHIITTETNRCFRVERNKERYKELLQKFSLKENMIYTSSIVSVNCVEEMEDCLLNKKGSIKNFLASMDSNTREKFERNIHYDSQN